MDNSVLYLSSIPESIVYTCPPLKHPDAALPLMSKVCQCWSAQNAGMLIFNTVENIELCMVILVLFGTHLLHWFAHLLHIGLLLFSSNCPPSPPCLAWQFLCTPSLASGPACVRRKRRLRGFIPRHGPVTRCTNPPLQTPNSRNFPSSQKLPCFSTQR